MSYQLKVISAATSGRWMMQEMSNVFFGLETNWRNSMKSGLNVPLAPRDGKEWLHEVSGGLVIEDTSMSTLRELTESSNSRLTARAGAVIFARSVVKHNVRNS